jgi:O-antigen/teichoic acid export membrane protein
MPNESTENAASPATGIARKASRGVLWSVLTIAGTRLLGQVSNIILARLLTPDDFGLIYFANVIIALVTSVQNLGLGAALIQREGDIQEAADSAFLLNLATGGVLFVVGLALSPLAALYLRQPEVGPIVRVLSWTFVIYAFGVVQSTLLQRELDFRGKFFQELTPYIITPLVALPLAVLGYGAWSLVYGQLAGAVGGVLVVWIVSPWRPTFHFQRKLLLELWRFGRHVLLSELLWLAGQNADYLVVGRFLGETALGYYGMALTWASLPFGSLARIVPRIAFPVFARLRNSESVVSGSDHGLTQPFLRTLRLVALVSLPLEIGLFIVAPDLVPGFLGEQWMPAVSILRLLALYGIFVSLNSPANSLYMSLDRPEILPRFILGWLVTLVPSLALGSRWGLTGVGVALIVCGAASTLVHFYLIGRLLDLPRKLGGFYVPAIRQMLQAPVLAAAAMGAVTCPVQALLPLSPLLSLLVVVPLGALVYLAFMALLDRSTLRDALDAIRLGVQRT